MKIKIVSLVCIVLLCVAFVDANPGAAAPALSQLQVGSGITEPGYLAIPASAFFPMHAETDYENNGRDVKALSSDYFRAAVNLPHGAVVTKLTACFYDDSVPANTTLTLYSTVLDSITERSMAQVSSSTSAGYIHRSATNIDYASVDNLLNSYYVVMLLPQSTGPGGDLWGCGVFITYTLGGVPSGVISVPGAAFRPWVDGYNAGETQANFAIQHFTDAGGTTANGGYLAQVNIPHGATVNKVTLYYADGRSDKDIVVWLQRGGSTGVYENMASVVSYDLDNSQFTEAISNPIVNNFDYSYWLFLDLPAHAVFTPAAVIGVIIQYSSPAESGTGRVSLSNAAFVGFHDAFDFENHARWLFHKHGEGGSSAEGVYVAPVFLPQGVKVIDFRAAFYDGSSTLTGSAYLVRTRLGENEILGSVDSIGSGGYQVVLTDNISYGFVDNTQYAYFVYWSLPVSTYPLDSGDVTGCRILIRYLPQYPIHLPLLRK